MYQNKLLIEKLALHRRNARIYSYKYLFSFFTGGQQNSVHQSNNQAEIINNPTIESEADTRITNDNLDNGEGSDTPKVVVVHPLNLVPEHIHVDSGDTLPPPPEYSSIYPAHTDHV